MTAGPGWERALERAARSRLTLLLGDSDAGKTALATFLANGLSARGFRVGVVDADLGQSEIGPPTTIGLGRVTRVLDRLRDADPAGLFFVGSTSPQGHLRSTVAGVRRMADRAAALGLERVLVDTSGLIEGELGRTLKRRKIEILDPDLLIGLQREEECEPLLRLFAARRRPAMLRLPVGDRARKRSADERRRHREAALDAYVRHAAPLRLALPGLSLRRMGDGHLAAPVLPLDGEDLEGRLVGLDDPDGDTLGLGVIRAVDPRGDALVLDTPVREAQIAGLRLGRHALLSAESVR